MLKPIIPFHDRSRLYLKPSHRDLRPLTVKNEAVQKSDFSENRKVATMFLVYKDEHQSALFRLMEEFWESVKVLRIDYKTTEFTGLNLIGRADSLC